MGNHQYRIDVTWTGNTGNGTRNYRGYERSHNINADGKPIITASSDPAFRGDQTKYNPEELLVASVSSCHMLWHLHLCSEAGVIVVSYIDQAIGTMSEEKNGSGRFTEITLYPAVTVSDESMVEKANALHHDANKMCFIANSCNFPIYHKPTCEVKFF